MSPARRTRLGLGTAIALSIALHLAVVPFVHAPRASAEPMHADPPLRIETIARVRPTPRPTPRRTLRASPRAHALAPVRRPQRPLPSREIAVVSRGVPVAMPDPRATASTFGSGPASGPGDDAGDAPPLPAPSPVEPPSATATPTAACGLPDSAARVVAVVEPEISEGALERRASGTVDVRVDLSDRGTVVSVAVVTSPDVTLDEPALDAARRSTYAAEIADCHARAGSYLFRVDFDG